MHGARAGLLAGVALGAVEIAASTILSDDPLLPFDFAAALIVGPEALLPAVPLAASLALGTILHVLLSILFGVAFWEGCVDLPAQRQAVTDAPLRNGVRRDPVGDQIPRRASPHRSGTGHGGLISILSAFPPSSESRRTRCRPGCRSRRVRPGRSLRGPWCCRSARGESCPGTSCTRSAVLEHPPELV